MKLAALLITALAVMAGVGVSTASAAVQDCRYPMPTPSGGYGPRNDRSMNGGLVSVRNMSCSAALRAISNGYLREDGTPLRTRGFRCYVVSKSRAGGSGYVTSATIRCVSGVRAFRFSWAI